MNARKMSSPSKRDLYDERVSVRSLDKKKRIKSKGRCRGAERLARKR